jgi:hypothetical protein
MSCSLLLVYRRGLSHHATPVKILGLGQNSVHLHQHPRTWSQCVLTAQVHMQLTCNAAVTVLVLAGLRATAAGSASCSTSRPTGQSVRGSQDSLAGRQQ